MIIFMRQHLKTTAYFLFFFLVTLGVTGKAESKKDVAKIKITFKPKSHGNYDIKKFKLNHPINISDREIINHLVSLKYIGNFLMSKEERVFSLAEVQKLAPILVKAFSRIGTRKIIHIELESSGGLTSGDVFSFRKHLNWRFESIRGESFFQKNDVREWNVFAWKLVPQKGQLFFKSGAKEGKRLRKNWIVSNLKLPTSDQTLGDNVDSFNNLETGSSKDKIDQKLEKKLKHLKYLRDKNLIDEEEYKTQQKKLFDKLF